MFYPNSPHLTYTHIYIDHFVPVWIYWGLKLYSEVNYNVYLNMEKYSACPEHVQAEFERIRQCQLHDAMSTWDKDTGPPAPPMPEPGSGQLIGELPCVFKIRIHESRRYSPAKVWHKLVTPSQLVPAQWYGSGSSIQMDTQ